MLGQEDLKLPAGSFKAWKVELPSAEGDPGSKTFWVDSTSHRLLKIVETSPQMGGAVVTVELQN